MAAPLDFYFDFSSPYGYFASARVDDVARKHGRDCIWHPILLGVALKATGGSPLPNVPIKGDYAKHDIDRCARLWGIDYRFPSTFPIASQAPSRAFYWLSDRDPERAKALARALYRAYFVDDVNISDPENTVWVAEKFGLDAEAVRAAISDPAIKERLKDETQTALERGIFGSPFIVVDGEPFWGADRLDQVDRWLATGGW